MPSSLISCDVDHRAAAAAATAEGVRSQHSGSWATANLHHWQKGAIGKPSRWSGVIWGAKDIPHILWTYMDTYPEYHHGDHGWGTDFEYLRITRRLGASRSCHGSHCQHPFHRIPKSQLGIHTRGSHGHAWHWVQHRTSASQKWAPELAPSRDNCWGTPLLLHSGRLKMQQKATHRPSLWRKQMGLGFAIRFSDFWHVTSIYVFICV